MSKTAIYQVVFLVLMAASSLVKGQLPKQHLQRFNNHPFTFTTQIPFDKNGVILQNSNFQQPQPEKITAMPLIPLSRLAQKLPCYQYPICIDNKHNRYKGLRCCKHQDNLYQRMISDSKLYVAESKQWTKIWQHYQPVDKLSDYKLVSGIKINHKSKQFIPPIHTQKTLAKTYMHFHHQYQLSLTNEEITLFRHWL